MDPNLVKQAYAYGAAIALQELGFDTQRAEAASIKLAEDAMEEDVADEDGNRPNYTVRSGLGAAAGIPVGFAGGAASGALLHKLLAKDPGPYPAARTPGDKTPMGKFFRSPAHSRYNTNQMLSALAGMGLGAIGGGLGGGAIGQIGNDEGNQAATATGAGLGALTGGVGGLMAGGALETALTPTRAEPQNVRRNIKIQRNIGPVGRALTRNAIPIGGGLGAIGGGIGAGALANYLAGKLRGGGDQGEEE